MGARTAQRLAALLLLTVAGLTAAAQTFGGGSGTKSDPYIIKTTTHLNSLASKVNGGTTYEGQYFRLDANLNYSGNTYTPIGHQFFSGGAREFRGNFDGNGHTISNVNYSGSTFNDGQGVGLFGNVNGGVIENLTLGGNSTIRGFYHVGGIVGRLNSGTIRNCHVAGSVTIGVYDNDSPGNVGGIIGSASCFNQTDQTRISIMGCTNAATVDGNKSGASSIGGIVGYLNSFNNNSNTKPVVITDCANSGSVKGIKEVGGVVGSAVIISDGQSGIFSCVNTANVSGNSYVGGILGRKYQEGDISGCIVTGGCTIGALGVEGSATGTYEGIGAKRCFTLRSAYSHYTYTITTAPVATIGGKDYYEAGSTIMFSAVSAFGSPTTGKVWSFVAEEEEGTHIKHPILPLADGTWRLTMPAKDAIISANAGTDITQSSTNSITATIQPGTWTGAKVTPVVKVWDAKAGKYLTEGTDFVTDVPASGFTDVGEYPVTIWGIGSYGGRIDDKTFTLAMPWEGEGTQAKPYLIKTTDDFALLAQHTNSGLSWQGVCFRQTAALDFTGKTFVPVANAASTSFEGTYDGSSYTMKGISLSGQSLTGVFGRVGSHGSLRYVILTGTNSFSGAGEYTGTIAACNYGTMEGCQTDKDATVTVTTTGSVAGGIAGLNAGFINSCENYMATVTASCAGGIVGLNNSNQMLLGTNYATVTGTTYAGGICGRNQKGEVIGQHYGSVKASASTCSLGGIAGQNDSGGTVGSSLSTDLLSSVGGTGKGAIVGVNSGTVKNCYYIGSCQFGGIGGNDVTGQAMRGWPITVSDERIAFAPDYSTGSWCGTYYNDEAAETNHYYIGEGETLRFLLQTGGLTPGGFTLDGTALNPSGTTRDGDTYYQLTMVSGGMTIGYAGDFVLELLDDDSSDNWPNDIRLKYHDDFTGTVRLCSRTLYKDGKWNTLCLPFDVTLSGSPLDGAEARKVTEAHIEGTTLHLTFGDPVTTLTAGTPYIIKWTVGTHIVSPVFSGVSISASRHDYDNGQSGDSRVRFLGRYVTTKFAATDYSVLLMGEGNTLRYPGAGAGLGGMRAYFKIGDGTAPARRLTAFSLDFGDGPTAIRSITPSSGTDDHSAVYTLDGRRVAGGQRSIDSGQLKKGVYIMNHKKVVIK